MSPDEEVQAAAYFAVTQPLPRKPRKMPAEIKAIRQIVFGFEALKANPAHLVAALNYVNRLYAKDTEAYLLKEKP